MVTTTPVSDVATALQAHSLPAGMLVDRVARLRRALEQLRLADPLMTADRHVLELLPTLTDAVDRARQLGLLAPVDES